MDAIRRLCQSDPEAGMLAPGRLRLHQDARGGVGCGGSGLVLVRHPGAGSGGIGEADARVQAKRGSSLCAMPAGCDGAVAQLLVAIGRAGIELAPHPTDPAMLRHRPAELPSDLSARLRMHRAEARWLLAGGYAPDPAGDAGHALAERLGIADDLGMPAHPGAPAWLVAVGESMGACCHTATSVVYSGHGTTDGRDRDGDSSERQGTGRNSPGRGGGP